MRTYHPVLVTEYKHAIMRTYHPFSHNCICTLQPPHLRPACKDT